MGCSGWFAAGRASRKPGQVDPLTICFRKVRPSAQGRTPNLRACSIAVVRAGARGHEPSFDFSLIAVVPRRPEGPKCASEVQCERPARIAQTRGTLAKTERTAATHTGRPD